MVFTRSKLHPGENCWPQEHKQESSWNQKTDITWHFTLMPANPRIVYEMIIPSAAPSLTMLLKPLESWGLFDYEFQFSLPGSCSKYCAFLYHSLVSVDWLCCTWASGPKFDLVTMPCSFLSSLACCPQNTQSHWASSKKKLYFLV